MDKFEFLVFLLWAFISSIALENPAYSRLFDFNGMQISVAGANWGYYLNLFGRKPIFS